MTEDPRCCGSGTCIIDAEGRCWCGQRWDGQRMCHAPLASAEDAVGNDLPTAARAAEGGDAGHIGAVVADRVTPWVR